MNRTRNVTTSTGNFRGPDTVTEAIVSAVADAEGASPLELQPLITAIDPDALGALVRDSEDVTVEFEYHGYRVCVFGDGRLTVCE